MEVKTWKDIDRDSKIAMFIMTMAFFAITAGLLKSEKQRHATMFQKQIVSEQVVNNSR